MKLLAILCLLVAFAAIALAENKVLIQTSLQVDINLDGKEQELLKCFTGFTKDLVADLLNLEKKCKIDVLALADASQFFASPALDLKVNVAGGTFTVDFDSSVELDFTKLNLAFYLKGECDWKQVQDDFKANVKKNCPKIALAVNNALPFDVKDGKCVDCPAAAKAECSRDAGCLSNNCQAGICSNIVAYKQNSASTMVYGTALAAAAVATVVGLF